MYKTGDLVWARVPEHSRFVDNPAYPGIVPREYPATIIRGTADKPGWYDVDAPDLPRNAEGWLFRIELLRPRDPPKETLREELSSWELCPWQPTRGRFEKLQNDLMKALSWPLKL